MRSSIPKGLRPCTRTYLCISPAAEPSDIHRNMITAATANGTKTFGRRTVYAICREGDAPTLEAFHAFSLPTIMSSWYPPPLRFSSSSLLLSCDVRVDDVRDRKLYCVFASRRGGGGVGEGEARLGNGCAAARNNVRERLFVVWEGAEVYRTRTDCSPRNYENERANVGEQQLKTEADSLSCKNGKSGNESPVSRRHARDRLIADQPQRPRRMTKYCQCQTRTRCKYHYALLFPVNWQRQPTVHDEVPSAAPSATSPK